MEGLGILAILMLIALEVSEGIGEEERRKHYRVNDRVREDE